MFFKQLATKGSSLAYFFGCGGKGKAVAVDVVAGDEHWFVDQAYEANVSITHVIDTHVHADHYSGGKRLAEMTGAQYCLHENNVAVVNYEFQALRDGSLIEAGNVVIKVVHTPGHTLDSICLVVTDKRRADQPWFVLTGDTLFVGAVGRPDLAGEQEKMAGMLYDSITRKLLTLPHDVEIFPGHQAGSLCGAGLSGKPSSTIGFEKRFNAGLQHKTKEEFIKALVLDIPPRPDDMTRMVAVNCGVA
ncbi:MAG: MBL fold metallo-hydrolase [Pseudomonadota bacterium]